MGAQFRIAQGQQRFLGGRRHLIEQIQRVLDFAVRQEKLSVIFLVPGLVGGEGEHLLPDLPGFFRVGFFQLKCQVAHQQGLTGVELREGALDKLRGFLFLTGSQGQKSDFSKLIYAFEGSRVSPCPVIRRFRRIGGQKAGGQAFNKLGSFNAF